MGGAATNPVSKLGGVNGEAKSRCERDQIVRILTENISLRHEQRSAEFMEPSDAESGCRRAAKSSDPEIVVMEIAERVT